MMTKEVATEVLKEAGITVIETQTSPSRKGKQPRPVWEILGADKYEGLMHLKEMPVKRWRGKLSCWEDPTEQLAELIKVSAVKSEELGKFSELLQKGLSIYSQEVAQVGDWVYCISSWRRVYEVGEKAVVLHFTSHEQPTGDAAEYGEIKKWVPKDKAEAFAAQFNIDLSQCHKTKLNLALALEEVRV